MDNKLVFFQFTKHNVSVIIGNTMYFPNKSVGADVQPVHVVYERGLSVDENNKRFYEMAALGSILIFKSMSHLVNTITAEAFNMPEHDKFHRFLANPHMKAEYAGTEYEILFKKYESIKSQITREPEVSFHISRLEVQTTDDKLKATIEENNKLKAELEDTNRQLVEKTKTIKK